VAEALVGRLRARGFDARLTDQVPTDADGVIYLGGLQGEAGAAGSWPVHRDGFLAAQTVARKFAAADGLFVTVQDTGGSFGLTDLTDGRQWLAGLPGLAKTAAMEWPNARVKAIDLEIAGRGTEALAEALLGEVLHDGPEIEVGLRTDGRRVTLMSHPSPLVAAGTPRIDESSVLVVSGGGRGITAATLQGLARSCRPRFALLGRTRLEAEPDHCRAAENEAELKEALLNKAIAEGRKPTPMQLARETDRILAVREVRATLRHLEELGSPARYVALDIRDPDQVSNALASVRDDWGPITGLIHGAGVIADKRIADKTVEQVETVFRTKVDGLRALLAATSGDPLELICLFSSVAARTGNIGQCDYAMANEVLNKVAQAEARRRQGRCLVKSINWGPWAGGMVTASLARGFAERGISLIPLAEGTEFLLRELTDATGGSVEVIAGGQRDDHAAEPAGMTAPPPRPLHGEALAGLAD
jgi:NAD(P)-dependent dehydrogenase (short-subunit alcohol dehydrogenase family)